MKVFITKYALTVGIQEINGELYAEGRAVMWGAYHESAHGEGKDWHRTRDGAVARAKLMRDKKIIAMKARIAKLEKMTWE